MGVDLKIAVMKNIEDLKKAISVKASEMAQLESELKRHETVLELLRNSGGREKGRAGTSARRGRMNLRDVLAQLPEKFTSRDFVKAAVRTRKPSVYL